MSLSVDPSGALLAQAAADYAAGRMAEAEQALAQAGPGAAGNPAFWELTGSVALARGAAAEGVAALQRATAMVRAATGRDSHALLMNLVAACEAAGQLNDAASALQSARRLSLEVSAGKGRAAEAAAARGVEIDGRLAVLLWHLARHDEAIAAYVRAAAATPEDAAVLGRLGVMLAWRGRTLEGLVALLHAALLQPAAAVPARDVAQLLGLAGAASAARGWYRRALALQPDEKGALAALAEPPQPDTPARWDAPTAIILSACHAVAEAPGGGPVRDEAGALVELAEFLARAHRPAPAGTVAEDWALIARDGAMAALRRALTVRPDQPGAQALLGEMLFERSDYAMAEAALRAALKLAPLDAALHARLGNVLTRLWRLSEAAASYRASLGLLPDQPAVMSSLANALMGDWPDQEVMTLLRRVQELDPSMPDGRAGIGLALLTLQRPAEALVELRAALVLRPDEANLHFASSVALLAQGDFAAAWAEYAWRWRIEDPSVVRRPANPLQKPDPASWAGRTVLLYAEQGQGDTIQFLRYVRLVVATGARVLLEVQRSLKSLAAGIPGIIGAFAQGETVPPHDLSVPLLHLPWAFDTTLRSIPATVPYLRADLSRAAAFRRRMQGLPGLKVGLVWSGDPRPHRLDGASMDRRRSTSLATLAPVARVPGVVFVSLQKGAPAAQATTPPPGMVLHDWTSELEDFAATGALMGALDLVISVDTAPAHLAGALGRPVWLLNRFDSEWRWLRDRDDSPWYPTLRQFRQTRPGDWDGVVARVAEALAERAG